MLFSLTYGVEAMISAETSKEVKSESTEKILTRSSNLNKNLDKFTLT
ncbi:BnaA02g22530D [Brassica napus]|uniref:BnaA02g22530D protein n=1 Tax=Brassica napus TaxID=3708 RepID=A0A078FP60_BRANA|nr:BnaA02g22530D [Brassica napus]